MSESIARSIDTPAVFGGFFVFFLVLGAGVLLGLLIWLILRLRKKP